jgi:hemerythrin-like metal-binding protein
MREAMMGMTCTKQLSVGNRMIDSAHKEVFGMIDRIVHSVMARDVAALSEAFCRLENCLYVYFSVEEDIAQAVSFDFTQHRLAHQELLKKFQRMKDWLMAKNGAWSKFEEKGCIDSLGNCLIWHIKEDSAPLKVVLNTHFYNFAPEFAGDRQTGDVAPGAAFSGFTSANTAR